MNTFSFRSLAFAFAVMLGASTANAQETKAVASPAATATGKAGAAEITVKYSSPSVKGRTIWGNLVPYGQVWRAGANEATTVEFSKPVKVEGKDLPAGKYAFFLVPGKQEWKVVFNKTANQWGAFKYDETKDALRVSVKPIKTEQMSEQLKYEVTPTGLVMRWENLEVPVSIK